jgi:hypothetical protein
MEPSQQQHLLAQQANDLLNRLHLRRVALYRDSESNGMSVAEYKQVRARILHASERAFNRLSRRLAPFL